MLMPPRIEANDWARRTQRSHRPLRSIFMPMKTGKRFVQTPIGSTSNDRYSDIQTR